MLLVFGWSIGAFAEPLLLGAHQRAARRSRWTLYQRGVVQNDYGLVVRRWASCCSSIAFVVTYFSLRYSRGALVE